MKTITKNIILILVLVSVVLSIWLLGGFSSSKNRGTEIGITDSSPSILAKQAIYPRAIEIEKPSGFINTDEDFRIADQIGKKVILVDFWTYSCINCQRTQPYLNAWNDKYKDSGLLIVGIHTPEFGFEEVLANVQRAVEDAGIEYPVILDNDRGTWDAYSNRYWPHKFLIDIDGFIVYDHIGEGGYEETEELIQKLLKERSGRLDMQSEVPEGISSPDAEEVNKVGSPETYFGAWRNKNFGNGTPGLIGSKEYKKPSVINPNEYYLNGYWKTDREFVQNTKAGASITFHYYAQKVFMVAHSERGARIRVFLDGEELPKEYYGSDVKDGVIQVDEERLYRVVEGVESGEHTLEIVVENGEVQIYTYTFG